MCPDHVTVEVDARSQMSLLGAFGFRRNPPRRSIVRSMPTAAQCPDEGQSRSPAFKCTNHCVYRPDAQHLSAASTAPKPEPGRTTKTFTIFISETVHAIENDDHNGAVIHHICEGTYNKAHFQPDLERTLPKESKITGHYIHIAFPLLDSLTAHQKTREHDRRLAPIRIMIELLIKGVESSKSFADFLPKYLAIDR
ncbi:hypothetical protein SCHPADRAFT_891381 [Schizopora paradoxa]|uniref:Uncharacterized protein n=1 Tax=Schizopora paradoxa TaxID=27342 RepID=A0A0H2S403_9AGAM|nr:hypothetical protein SCHPADRAFT_891381 [Schizopora paradoxa]